MAAAAKSGPRAASTKRVEIRVLARALEGMQKEALVRTGGRDWHMVCD